VDWRPVVARRRKAEVRIQAVEEYAKTSRCRRSRLVAYFGEQLKGCAGCDRCGKMQRALPADPRVAARLAQLREALAGRKAVWGGCPIEPDVLLRLAKNPPRDAASLADVPGVGSSITERLGGAILVALSSGSDPGCHVENQRFDAFDEWRAGVARMMGVPVYAIISDAVLRAISAARPKNHSELARIPGLGPRAFAKFGEDLLELSRSPGTSVSSSIGAEI
jgi:superfamily II DNA helicase RecQ